MDFPVVSIPHSPRRIIPDFGELADASVVSIPHSPRRIIPPSFQYPIPPSYNLEIVSILSCFNTPFPPSVDANGECCFNTPFPPSYNQFAGISLISKGFPFLPLDCEETWLEQV